MSDKISLLRDTLKKSRMKEIMQHFSPKSEGGELKARDVDVADDNETHQETRTTPEPKYADPVEKTHALDRRVSKIGTEIKGMSEGGITVEDEETLPDLNSEEQAPEDEDSLVDQGKVPLGNSADLDNVPAIQRLRRRKDRNTNV